MSSWHKRAGVTKSVNPGPRVEQFDVQFGGVKVEVGAHWVHYAELERTDRHILESVLNRTNLNFLTEDYEDITFRF